MEASVVDVLVTPGGGEEANAVTRYDKNDRTKFLPLAIVLLALGFSGCQPNSSDPNEFPEVTNRSTERPSNAQEETVERVVDGDTLHLKGFGSSRLIGIDTPETYEGPECFGQQASDFLETLLRPGEHVFVARDREARDKYDRLLVYLWTKDGRMINQLILNDGFAVPLAIRPNTTFATVFQDAADAARTKNIGLWGACRGE